MAPPTDSTSSIPPCPSSPTEAASLRPTPAAQRIESLDFARGFALLGIFMVNIQLMTQPLSWMFFSTGTQEGPLATTHTI